MSNAFQSPASLPAKLSQPPAKLSQPHVDAETQAMDLRQSVVPPARETPSPAPASALLMLSSGGSHEVSGGGKKKKKGMFGGIFGKKKSKKDKGGSLSNHAQGHQSGGFPTTDSSGEPLKRKNGILSPKKGGRNGGGVLLSRVESEGSI